MTAGEVLLRSVLYGLGAFVMVRVGVAAHLQEQRRINKELRLKARMEAALRGDR